jgi:TolB-like protein/DNA-binding winged helix-turn-helix (wHTH) protein/Flp pilus assembly protein TadD
MRFGLFEFDPQAVELRKQGLRIRLQGQPVEILALLLTRPGEVVTREELRSLLWPADTFVDFDRSLNAAVKRLRAALGDSADTPRYIETLARRGYRLIAPVDTRAIVPAGTAAGPSAGAAAEPSAGLAAIPEVGSTPHSPSRRSYVLWIAPVAVALAFAGLALHWGNNPVTAKRDGSEKQIQSLLVLPLKSLSGDPEQQYFADGMTDALNARLAGVSALRVISQTSSMLYRGTSKSLSQIASEVNVDGIVEGSVLRAGDRVRINVQLVWPGAEKRIWGQTYERDVQDVLALQSEVARAIVDEIRVTLRPGEQARLNKVRDSNPEAHIAYAKGRFFWNQRTDEGLRKAVAYFGQAIEKDRGYALAYAGLADSWVPRAWYAYLPPKEAFPHARAAALKALELDPDLAEAHTTLAFLKLYYEWDWDGAERQFRRAIELNPNYANAHHWYAEYLSLAGRHEAAIREAERARELDPFSSIIHTWVGSRYFFASRYDLAIEQYRNVVELDPTFVPARLALGQAYVQKKMLPEAITELRTAVKLSGGSPVYIAALAHAFGVTGRRSEALKSIQELEQLARRRYVASFDMAIAWLGVSDNSRTLSSLEKALEDRSPRLLFLNVDPRFAPLRTDDRFRGLIQRVGPFK